MKESTWIIIFIFLAIFLVGVGINFNKHYNVSTIETGIVTDKNLVRLTRPLPNALVESPLVVSGEARGNWYFEASFPIKLYDANGKELTVAVAQAQGEWMTTEFVPFETILTFPNPITPTGTLVLEKDNPSGLPEHADELRIPVRFNYTRTSTQN